MRRALLLVAAVGTLVEGVAIAGWLLIVSKVIGAYSMSLNGSDPSTARAALWVFAGIVAVAFVGLAAALVAMAVRDRPRRGPLIAATATQWVLAVVAGIVTPGWAFAFALGMCGVFMGVLFAEPSRPTTAHPARRAS